MENKSYGNTNYNWFTLNTAQRIGKRTGRLGNQSTNGDHLDEIFITISKNTEKSHGDLRKFVKICCHSNSSEKRSGTNGVKYSQE